ncbi:MAG: IclR family transcriptional regulator [Nocardioidaceae bacterium]
MRPSADGLPPASRVQSVDRAMRLLRAVAAARPDRSTAAQLAEACDLNRATAWRILSTLETHGVVGCDRETGRWSVGSALVELARAAGPEAVVRDARAVLERLRDRTGETAAIALVDGAGLTYVDEATSDAVVSATWRGRTVPLHATSTGKALLSATSPARVTDLLGPTLRRYTDTTVTDLDALRDELAETRQRGWGVCRGEFESSAWGVSAPVLDSLGSPLAVVSIWGPGSRLDEARLAELGVLVREAALSLSRG